MKARPLCVALLAVAGVWTGGLAGCGASDEASFSAAAPAGTERAPCRSDNSCDAGLECRSDLCVGVSGGSGSGGSSSTTGGSSIMSAAGDSSTTGGKGNPVGGTNTGGTNTGGTSTGGSNSSEAGAPPAGGDGAGGAPSQCEASHPLVVDKTRFCAPGSCYCNDPFDTCFPEETAAACCGNTPLCGKAQADRGVSCAGQHPIVEPTRTCESGNCFCSDGDLKKWDVCLPEDVAAFCCPPGVSLTCVD